MNKQLLTALAVVVVLGAGGTALAAQPDGVGKPVETPKPVMVTICHSDQGKSGKDNVTLQVDENAVPAHLAHGDTKGACAKVEDPETPLPPAGCKIGRVESYRDEAKQDPICVDDSTGTTADSDKGEVKSTTPTPVEEPVYEEFQGK